jgi:hypothetical protein
MTRHIALLIVVAVGLLATGCQGEDSQLLVDLAVEWAKENAQSVLWDAVWGTTGDGALDAILGSKKVIDDITKGDALMAEGRANGDFVAMEQAIELRPGDYTYRVSYSAALLGAGDTEEARYQLQWGAAAVAGSHDHIRRFSEQGVQELEALGPELVAKGFASQSQCEEYYFQLEYHYDNLARLDAGAGYRQQAVFAKQELAACGQEFVSP